MAWSDDDGNICVARSTCPHLGSALSPDVGGRVKNGRLVCPFHGFEYNTSGKCVATPSAPPPKSARLSVYEVRELNGMVFAWSGRDGRDSQWQLPPDPVDEGDWTTLRVRSIRFKGHPQETTENAVDLAHLSSVHGYTKVQPVGDIFEDGTYFRYCWNFRRKKTLFWMVKTTIDVSVTANIHGLGYSLVEMRLHNVGMDGRLWILATPEDGETIELKIALQLRSQHRPIRSFWGLRFLPTKLRTELLNQIVVSTVRSEVLEDITIWENKRFRPLPRLTRDETGILKYRRYCEQFYGDDREGSTSDVSVQRTQTT